jgi:colanic acid biosynthesis glycosyl transferase WcaI
MSSPRRKRVILLNRYFYPDHAATSELLSDLSFALSRRGFAVIVITSRLRYDNPAAALPSQETVQDVDIRRVWTSRRGRHRLIGRSLDYLSFYLSAGWCLWRLARRGDVIVAMTDPPLLSVIVAPVALMKGARLVNWLQDLFPEVAEALNVGGPPARFILRALRKTRNWSLRSAAMNIVPGMSVAAKLKQEWIAADHIRMIANWSDGALIVPIPPADNQLRKEWDLNEHFVVGYAGNLGRAHDLTTIVEAMTLLQERSATSTADAPPIMFVFVGGGAQRGLLEREMLQRRLTNVRMFPYQPRENLAETLGVADLHLVSLDPRLEGLIVPSKFYGIAAAGRPALYIGFPEGEIARLLEEARCGFTVASGDAEGLVARILDFARDPELCRSMGARARAAFEQHWDKPHALDEWEQVLTTALQLTSEATPGLPD